MIVDVRTNRTSRKWSRREQIGRLLWGIASLLFSFSPRPLWAWRRWLLRQFGAKVSKGAHVFPSVRITMPWNLVLGDDCAVGDRAILYALGKIEIGPRATLSQGVHVCAGTHDWQDPAMPLLKPTIKIGADTWICADAFLGPGITIGDRAIVGARAVVMTDVASSIVIAGNPARKIRVRDP